MTRERVLKLPVLEKFLDPAFQRGRAKQLVKTMFVRTAV